MFKDYSRLLALHRRCSSTSKLAEALGCKWETVDAAIGRLEKVWGSLALIPPDISNTDIIAAIKEAERKESRSPYFPIDAEKMLEEQRQGKNRNQLWAEYVSAANEAGMQSYQLSRFNEIISDFADHHNITIAVDKNPGIRCEVDWVGDKGHIYDSDTGEVVDIHVFVMALPYSGMFYCEGFLDEKMDSWLSAHEHAFEFFGGCPAVLCCDNCKTAIIKGKARSGQDFIVNEKYKDFADHYGMTIMPARIRKAKDKSTVERSVQIVEKDIMPELEKADINTLDEYNRIMLKKLEKRLARPFTKRYGSRLSVFEAEEKDTLSPLPRMRFESFTEKKAVVQRDSMIQYRKALYSVPPKYIGKSVIVRFYDGTLYIYNADRQLIAEHKQAAREWQRVVNPEHMKVDTAKFGGYSVKEFEDQARSYGGSMLAWVRKVISSRKYEAESYRTLLGAFKAARSYAPEVVEDAASRAVAAGVVSTRGFSNILADESRRLSSVKKQAMDYNSIYLSHEEVEA